MITFEIVESQEKIKKYYAEWDRMFDSGEYEASLSVEWTEALRKTHLDGALYFLLVLRESTEIAGMVPLCIREVKKRGLSLSTLFPLAEYFNTHSDLLMKNKSEELAEAFLKALFTLPYRWDIFRINRFIETSPVLDCIKNNLEKNFTYDYDIRRAEPSFYIPFGNSYEEYLNKKSSNFRNNLKRASKKMDSLGKVAFLRNHDFHDVNEAYAAICSIEEKSWKQQHGTAITSTDKQREFYRVLCQGASDKGRLRFCILTLNSEPVAFEMGLLREKKYYGVHGSYDETYKKENPGTVLLAKFIEDLIHDGIREYDWFGEPFEWESRWTDQYRWHKSLIIYNKTPKAQLFFIFNTVKNIVKQNAGDRLVLRDPRDIKPQGIE